MEIEEATEEDCVLVIKPNCSFECLLPEIDEEEDMPEFAFQMATLVWLLAQKEKFAGLMQEFKDECKSLEKNSKILN